MERRSGFEKSTGEKCFQLGRARDIWRETMLNVRLEGEAFALPYAHLNFIKCVGEHSLTLSFSSHLVKIRGQRLLFLYEALMEHSVRFVAVMATQQPDTTQNTEAVITSIDLVPVGQADGGML
jgi:hypothetical protein